MYDFCRRTRVTTYQRDAESGLDYALARYYSNTAGRFVTPDDADSMGIADPQSLNLYTYVLNDPINFVDPTGETVDIPISSTGGSSTSCLNARFEPLLNSHNVQLGNNLGNFASTNLGVLALTLYLEQGQNPTAQLYQDFAQVFANIYNLGKGYPDLAHTLGLATGSISQVIRGASNVWSGPNKDSLTNGQQANLINVLNGGSGTAGCDALILATSVAWDALNVRKIFDSSYQAYTGVGTNTYWFYNTGSRSPVQSQYWITQTKQVGGFTFESFLGSRPQPKPAPIPPLPGTRSPVRTNPRGPQVP